MQGTQLQLLVREDSTCYKATKPGRHEYWACVPGACAPQQEKPPQWETCALQLESRHHAPKLEKCLHAAVKTPYSRKWMDIKE